MGNCYTTQTLPDEEIYHDSTDENTPYVSYENMKRIVKVLRVVDGDTLDIALFQDDTRKIFKYRIRLYGIDTPEKKPLKSNPNREQEIAASKRARQAMHDRLAETRNIVTILFYKPDKYGRLLGTIYDKKGSDLNQWMIDQGHATAYFGKTKKPFEEQNEVQE